MSRTKTKQYIDEYIEYNKNMSKRKVFIAIRSPSEEAKGGLPSLTEKIDKKTFLDVLREKHPKSCKANLYYLVGNENPKKLALPSNRFRKTECLNG